MKVSSKFAKYALGAVVCLNAAFAGDALWAHRNADAPGPDRGQLKYPFKDGFINVFSGSADHAGASVALEVSGFAFATVSVPGILVGELAGKIIYPKADNKLNQPLADNSPR